MTVGQVEATMSYREYCEWLVLMQIDPWCEARADARAAIIAATISAAHGGSAKISDFMPRFDQAQKRELTADQWRAWANAVTRPPGDQVRR